MAAEKLKKIVPYVIILLVSLYFYHLAGHFRFSAKPGNLGPDFWPKLLLGLTMAACFYEIIKTAFFLRIAPQRRQQRSKPQRRKAKRKHTRGF